IKFIFKKKYNFFLVLDDAHSFGLFGNNLKGITENFEEEIDIITGTFSKAVGCQGGYVLSSNFIRNLIINKAYGLIYSTAVSPFLIGFAFYVIKNLIPNLKDEVKNLLELSDYLRNQIEVKGIYKTKGTSQIIPILQDFDFLENLQN
ncbi:MAG: aminotransferase class I/II-fold pyridoxal phosphate-dependent enzyme, partial [Bacilli bacterium]|nr:aminotransferase class I/II-fold pyridoxal phosphate-dependent enzyme [Bacilli bacterium]